MHRVRPDTEFLDYFIPMVRQVKRYTVAERDKGHGLRIAIAERKFFAQ